MGFTPAVPTATSSPQIHITSQQASEEKEPICEGANTRSPVIAQRRQKIAAKSVNCFFYLEKNHYGFKDTLLNDDSTAVAIHALHISSFAPSLL